MTDFNRLRERMDDSGMTIVAIARKSGMKRATLYKRLKGVGDFTASEMLGLSKTLHLTTKERNDIFFAEVVE